MSSVASSAPSPPTDVEEGNALGAIPAAERSPVVPSTTIVKGSVLVTPLPVNLPSIYGQMIHRFFPGASNATHERDGKKRAKREEEDISVSNDTNSDKTTANGTASATDASPTSSSSSSLFSKLNVINNDGESAILLMEVDSKEAAKKMFRRLHNARVCGRRWKVQYMRASELQCDPAPCLVECTLIPPVAASLAEEALASIPGFLAIAKSTPAALAGEKRSRSRVGGMNAEQREEGEEGVETPQEEEEILVKSVLASFCHEGSALHARAVLSGRLVGRSGARMFVKCRPPPSSSSSSSS